MRSDINCSEDTNSVMLIYLFHRIAFHELPATKTPTASAAFTDYRKSHLLCNNLNSLVCFPYGIFLCFHRDKDMVHNFGVHFFQLTSNTMMLK